MKNSSKTKQALIEELASLKERIAELEQFESERKQAEEMLQGQLHFLQQLLDAIPIPIFYKDRQGMFRGCNMAYENFVGMTKEQVVGKTVFEIAPQDLADIYCRADDVLFTQRGTQVYETSFLHADGNRRDIIFNKATYVGTNGCAAGLVGAILDITDRKRAEEALKEREEKYRNLFNNAEVGIFRSKLDGSEVMEVNNRFLEIVGMTREETIGKPSVNLWADPKERAEMVELLVANGSVHVFEYRMLNKRQGDVRNCLTSLRLYRKEGILEGSILDITERKKAEAALRDTETRYRLLFEHSPDGIVIIDPVKARPLEFNETAYRQLGYSREEFASLSISDFDADETPEDTREHIAKITHEGRGDFETRHRTKHGEIKNIHVTAQITEILGDSVYHCIWRDITDRKRAEEALRKSEEKFRKAFYTSPDSVNINRLEDGLYISINPGFTRIMGYTEEDIIGKTSIEYNIWDNREDRQRLVAGLRKDGEVTNLEAVFRTKGGDIRYGLMSASVIDLNGVPHILSITRDITERRQAERALIDSEKHYRSLFENMLNGFAYCRMLFDGDRPLDFIYLSVNNAFETLTGLKNVVGKKASEAIPGIRESDMELFEIYGRVALTGKPKQFERYVKALKMWFSVSVYSPEKEHFVAIFEVITERKQVQKQLEDTLESLRKAVGTTIQVMVSAVETRDPYTSGHQVRSANLARAIAMEMSLSQDKIDAIRMAGSIHDIGKLSIPAEILSKPSKLSDIEFSLIKEHAQKGYEMLKDVESPWPLAEIVYQHHERMDGSGYPRNLKGEEILIEARILSVADVVEAMASHRPYRPALGIDVALEEIARGKGVTYDPEATDACLRLFRDKGFQLARA
jgi:PAS domain S-box-containing protein